MILYISLLDTEADKSIFEEIYLDNRKLMLKIASGIVSSGWAEDAVHDAFLRIARHIGKFSAIPCNERRYLCVTIVRNVSLSMLRDSHSDKMTDLDEHFELHVGADIADEILRVERMSDIKRCIDALQPVLRDVVMLRICEIIT